MEQQEAIKSWEEAWNSRDPEKVIKLYSDNVYYRDATVAGGIESLDNFRAYLEKLFDLYPKTRIEVVEARNLKEGKQVFINWHAKVPDQVRGKLVTEIDGVTRMSIENGKIVREETFYDRLPIAVNLLHLLRMARAG